MDPRRPGSRWRSVSRLNGRPEKERLAKIERENQIFFGNCGDSRAILIGESVEPSNQEYEERGGSDLGDSIVILDCTRDHKPDLLDEADRIVNHYDGQINNTHAQTLVIQAIQG